jgi:4-hydroxy-3-methylbut-2-enyl diphosphate reductase
LAIREIAKQSDLVLVVGSTTSSNSKRLREVAEAYGSEAHLIMSPDEIRPEWKTNYKTVGISSGASTPEILVDAIVSALQDGRDIPTEEVMVVEENVNFQPNRDLQQLARARS